jgi:hypothetical protein
MWLSSYTSQETLTLLAGDNEPFVRYWIARHPKTAPETLIILANDEDSVVRSVVVLNPNTPQYIKDYPKACKFIEKLWI